MNNKCGGGEKESILNVKIPGLEEKNAEVFFLVTINSSLIKTLLLSPLACIIIITEGSQLKIKCKRKYP